MAAVLAAAWIDAQPNPGRAPALVPDGEIFKAEDTILEGISWASSVYAVALSPDGSMLATGSTDGVVHFWDLANGREIRRYGAGFSEYSQSVRSVAFSPDGRELAAAYE